MFGSILRPGKVG